MILEIDDKELDDFKKKHRHIKVNKGSIGGHISIIFTLTSVGVIPSCKCDICCKSKTLTYNL